MTSKPQQIHLKADAEKSLKKTTKGAAETSRLFIDVTDVKRRTQLPTTRYVE